MTTSPPSPPSALLTPQEAARLLRIHPYTLRKWATDGRVPVVRLPSGRYKFRSDDIETMLRSSAERDR